MCLPHSEAQKPLDAIKRYEIRDMSSLRIFYCLHLCRCAEQQQLTAQLAQFRTHTHTPTHLYVSVQTTQSASQLEVTFRRHFRAHFHIYRLTASVTASAASTSVTTEPTITHPPTCTITLLYGFVSYCVAVF